ncbi:uncharacterized protein LOC143211126 [Lasioglossum baleicum]|uniref:uncharacterized protein LOC143211126 n=1 Tax=Lasioglossum baleicum TaxID=434251 RepID=UPI003FCE5C1C
MASLKVLLSERKSIKCKLTRFKNYFESNQTDDSIPELRERFDRFLPLADKFDEVQSKIEIYTEDSGEDASHEIERDNFDKSYYCIVTSVKARLGIGQPQNSLQTGTSSQLSSSTETELPVKLPVIQLSTFDGAYGDWIRFRDTFDSLIHKNANINVIQKFNYLNSTLRGEAARSIRALGISESNYAILKNRYEDPQGLTRYHTKALFDIPPIMKTSARALRQLIDDCINHLKSLNSLQEPTQYWDTLIIHLLSTKLDGFTKREWEKVIIKGASNPSLKDMLEFLEGQSKYLARSGTDRGGSSRPQIRADGFYTPRYQLKTEESHTPRFNRNTVACVGISKTECKICNGNHPVYMCEKFRNSSYSERIDQVTKAGICFNCLHPGHKNLNCTRSGCKKCNKKHNILLHTDATSYSSQSKSGEPSTSTNNTISLAQTNFSIPHQFSHVVLATAIVLVEDKFGKGHECRALLDPASQASFITTNFCNRLKLSSAPTNGIVSGIGQKIGGVSQKTAIKLHSRNTEFSSSLSCFIIPKITEDLPNFCINRTKILIPHDIKLADPNFDETREIDLLISGELFWDLFTNEQNSTRRIDPLFRNTKLGWIFAGKLNNAKIRNTPKNLKLACNLVSNDILLSEIKKFWEIEHCYDTSIIVNQHDECERHYQTTTTRDSSGRYIVNIPFNDKLENLGNSRWLAEKRFYNLERKLNKQPFLKQDYIAFMTEYESLGHMTEISSSIDTNELNYYLPHHAVIKLDSTSTKLRVVFDGSAKTTTGISLNDTQRIGPTVQDELFSILLRFRSHQYVISADVQKMYRQILITPLQRKFQRILWRVDDSLPLKTYELNTITYGTASAPFLATRTLQRIGEECVSVSPIASRIIMKDFYVDDLLTGSDNFQEALAIKRDVSNVLNEAGLQLHKWASNDSRISEFTHEQSDSITIASDKVTKTLGLLWNPHTDTLKFLIKPPEQAKLTKRTILSEIARVFDPLGLIGPTTMLAKVFMQQLWQSKFSWDQSLPREFIAKWIQFRDELPELNKLCISFSSINSKGKIVLKLKDKRRILLV